MIVDSFLANRNNTLNTIKYKIFIHQMKHNINAHILFAKKNEKNVMKRVLYYCSIILFCFLNTKQLYVCQSKIYDYH